VVRWSAVVWPAAEPWYWPRGSQISIAGPGFDQAGAVAFAGRLDREVRATRQLPVRVLLVAVEDGRLVDGPVTPNLRHANPRSSAWFRRDVGGTIELERGDAWRDDPPGWRSYNGARPPGGSARVSSSSAAAGETRVSLEGGRRLVWCADADAMVPESEHRCHRGLCWSRLAELQACLVDLRAGPRVPLPELDQARRQVELTRLRAVNPAAEPWTSVCLRS